MAKLKSDPITERDIAEFVANDSDFGFEMRVLQQLRAAGFSCLHSGTYRDPVTDKIRQFDIRARMDCSGSTLALAVECKNLRPNNPLVLSAVPRTEDEAFHDLCRFRPRMVHEEHQVHPVTGWRSAYKAGDMVAKRTNQVGRDSSGELISNDEATFDKFNQAINGCRDLVSELALKRSPPFERVILPVLVVPAGLLWQVEYGDDGTATTQPRQVERAAFFVNHPWPVLLPTNNTISYRLSHVEFVTIDALRGITDRWLGPGGFFPSGS